MRLLSYFTGGYSYAVPSELVFTYALVQLRFLFVSYILAVMLFNIAYTVPILVVTVVLADLRFYYDFIDYINLLLNTEDDESSQL